MPSEAPIFYNPEHCHNESEVESKFIVHYLLPALGYSLQSWRQEVTFGNIRLDFLAVAVNIFGHRSHLQLIIEAKHPRQNLDRHTRKFRRYLTLLNVRYGILTNGRFLRIYEQVNGELTLLLQVSGHAIPQQIDQIRRLVSREALQTRIYERRPSIPADRLPILDVQSFPELLDLESFQGLGDRSVDSSIQLIDAPAETIPQISQPPSRLESTMQVIAIYHNKGGVGKTTTVINLAAALSKLGKRILVIDLDSQANTTYATGLVKFEDELTDTIRESYIYHVLKERNKFFIPEVVRRSSFTSPEFDVVPSHIDLMEREQEFVQTEQARTRLFRKLQDVRDRYDIVLIDTPPSLNIYPRIALIAADYLIIPSDLKPFANQGLRNVSRFVEDINSFREEMNREALNVLGVLPSKVLTAAKFVQHTLPKMEAIVRDQYGFSLFKTRIFERRAISAAIEETLDIGDLSIPNPRSILDFAPNSESAGEFEQLADEVLARLGA